MKRLLLIVAVLAAAALGYAAAPKSPYELPVAAERLAWLSSDAKQACNKLEFEWRLACNRIDPTPFKLGVEFDVVSMLPTVTERGLLVKMIVKARPGIDTGPGAKTWSRISEIVTRHALDFAKQRFGDGKMFEDHRNLYLAFCIGDSLVAVRTFDFQKYAPPKATPEQQQALLTELLTH